MPDPLEEMAAHYRGDGWEVLLRPRPDQIPPFFQREDIDLLAVKDGEYRALHASPGVAAPARLVSSGREPDAVHMRTLLAEAERCLRSGALEAALLLAWSVTEAALREKVRPPHAAFIRPPTPRDLMRDAIQRGVLASQQAADTLEHTWKLRTMVAHGLRPDELPPETVRALIDVARHLTASPPSEAGEADTFGLKDVRYGYGVRQSGELLSMVSSANRVLAEVFGQSASLVSAEWDRTEDSGGRSIVTLRLSDFAGSVTGTLVPNELRSYPTLRRRLYSLWGDLLQVRNHRQLQELGAEEGR